MARMRGADLPGRLVDQGRSLREMSLSSAPPLRADCLAVARAEACAYPTVPREGAFCRILRRDRRETVAGERA